jgi:hypothetical protein
MWSATEGGGFGFSPVFCFLSNARVTPSRTNIFAMNDATTSLLTEHFSYTPLVSLIVISPTRIDSRCTREPATRTHLLDISLTGR